jgi:two-component system sensor histidine kinase KdpD
MTGVRVRETIPDQVVAAADEVVLIDITPQSLIERLQAGKIYRPEAIQSALDNFFKIENLSALREVALRQVAEEVEAKRIPSGGGVDSRPRGDRLFESTSPQQIGERLLALVTPQPRAQRIVRRAWRSAQRLGAELDILWVQARDPNEEEQDQIEALRRLASVLGAHLLIERGDDVALVTQRVVRERGITYMLMGTPRERGAIARLLRPALPQRLLRLLPGIDLRIVADRTLVPERAVSNRLLEPAAEQKLLPERTSR